MLRTRPVVLIAVAASAMAAAALAAPAAAVGGEAKPYIVVFQDSVAHPSDVADEHRRDYGAQVTFTYESALKGYAASLTPQAYGEVMRDQRVAYVEADGVVQASTTQVGATWGLDRIDQRVLPLSTTYNYSATGAGVTAYVIDTGILLSHGEFTDRVASGYDAVDGGSADDCNGHGTHVAGTIGGAVYGVAKGVRLVAVRVLDCAGSGSWSGVIAGMDWVVGDHDAGASAVANMSLGGGASTAVDDATKRMIGDGVATAVAAGNGNIAGKAQDACNYSPARVPEALTIGATTSSDAKTSWSNYGSCVDFFAPGASIKSAWHTNDAATNTISGTSMAAPHVAGAAALQLQGASAATPQVVRDALYAASTKCVVTSSNSANNHLLFTGGGTDDTSVCTTTPTKPGKPGRG